MPQAVPYLIAVGKAIVEAAVVAAISYAVQEVLGLNDVPDPEASKYPQKQPIPPKQKAYGRGRVSGPFLFWETVGHYSFDIIALAKGPVLSIDSFYLNDDAVTLSGDIVNRGSDGRYRREGAENDTIRIQSRVGSTPSPPYSNVVTLSGGRWSNNHRADGVATMSVVCRGVKAELISRIYPNGPVQGSAVGHWAFVYDWRLDSTAPGGSGPQRRNDPSTWAWSENPVVCLVHDEWFERGHDFDYRFGPTLAQATVAANVCDELVPLAAGGTERRYTMFGMYRSNNPPKDLRLRFLACFDGMMIERGDGAFIILAGKYAAPTVTLNEDRIRQFRWRKVRRREDLCNTLSISYNSPDHDFTVVETEPWRDASSVAAIGEYTKAIELPWVTRNSQARRLGKAVFSRLNCEYDGFLVIDLSDDEAELEQRYFRVQNRLAPGSMWDVVVEVVGMTIDLVNRLVRLEVIKADPAAYDWNAATEEGVGPDVAPPPDRGEIPEPVLVAREIFFVGGVPRLRINIEDPDRDDYSYAIRWRQVATNFLSYVVEYPTPITSSIPGTIELNTGAIPAGADIEFGVAFINSRGTVGNFGATGIVNASTPGAAFPIQKNPAYPLSSDSDSIFIAAVEVVMSDGAVLNLPAGSVDGLDMTTTYGVFWRSDVGYEVEAEPAVNHLSAGSWIFLGWQATSDAGGVYPDPETPPPGSGGSYCPAPETLVLLAAPGGSGPGAVIPAGDLRPGDLVWTMHEATLAWGAFRVISAERHEDQQRVEVLTASGRSLVASADHRMFAEGLGWSAVRDMPSGVSLAGASPDILQSVVPASSGPVISTVIEGAHSLITAGLLSHNVKYTP